MRSLVVALFVTTLIATLVPETASARLFRRSSRRSNYTTTNYTSTNYTTTNYAPTDNTATNVSYSTTSTSSEDVSTAQGVANIMARTGRVGHWGGNPGYEGCGCGSSPQAAYSICCYANSGMATVDVGYAQGSNGMWFCCRRYR